MTFIFVRTGFFHKVQNFFEKNHPQLDSFRMSYFQEVEVALYGA